MSILEKLFNLAAGLENQTYEVWGDFGGVRYFEQKMAVVSAPSARDALDCYLQSHTDGGIYHIAVVRANEDPNVPNNVLAWKGF